MIALSILAGLLIWSGFPPLENPVAPIIGIALLFRLLLKDELKLRLTRAALVGLAFYLPLLHWSSSYVGATPWLILSFGQALFFSAIAFVSLKRNLVSVFLFASAVTVLEILRMKFPFGGFGWGRLGHTQVGLFGDLYPVLGVAGISFFVAFIAATLFIYPIKTLGTLSIILLSAQFLPQQLPHGKINVLAIQGGVDKLGLDFNDRAFSVLERHASLSRKKEFPADLIIWPENAADIDPIKNPRANAIVQEVVKRTGTKLLVGAVLQGDAGPKNASILVNADGEIKTTYLKQDLAPFGEYIPLRNLSEFIAPEAKSVRDFQPGAKWVWHNVSGSKFVSLICFEILDDDFVRTGISGAEFVVAQTNNATFGRSPQAAQQFQIARARAAELGRDFAVVSTTGFTGHVNREGKIIAKLDQYKPGKLGMKVETYRDRTLASQIGSWFWLALLGVALALRYRSIFTR